MCNCFIMNDNEVYLPQGKHQAHDIIQSPIINMNNNW